MKSLRRSSAASRRLWATPTERSPPSPHDARPKGGPARWIARALGSVAAVALALSLGLLLAELVEARRLRPAHQELLSTLERAVQVDARRSEDLSAEYERIRDVTLDRRDRFDVYTASLIVSAVVLLVAARWSHALGGERSPTFGEIARHRGDRSATAGRRRRERRGARGAAPAAPNDSGAPDVDLDFVDRIVREEGRSLEAAIPLLQRIQEHYRYLPDVALERLCELTEITPARIAGVSTFYSRFRRTPTGRWIVRVCHGTACHVSSATQITEEVRRRLRIGGDADTDSRRDFTVEEVACLGCCSLAPVLMIEGETVGRLSPADAGDAVDRWREERGG